MTTARAKGLHERTVLWAHGVRNALISIITVVTLALPGLFGGAFIIEWIFAWPGMGQLGINSINAPRLSRPDGDSADRLYPCPAEQSFG